MTRQIVPAPGRGDGAAGPPAPPPMQPSGRTASLAGIAAGAAGLGAAELAAGLLDPGSSPVTAVSELVVALLPSDLVKLGIRLFGTADKPVLLTLVAVASIAIAALAGWLYVRSPRAGTTVVGALVAVAGTAAWQVPDAGSLRLLPPLLAGGLMLALLPVLTAPPRAGLPTPTEPRWGDAGPVGVPSPAASATTGRRPVLLGAVAGAGLAAGIGGRLVGESARTVRAARDAIAVPRAGSAVTVPVGADLGIDGLAPYVTDNADFYRIDTALSVPRLAPQDWSLVVDGMVEEPFEMSWQELLDQPFLERLVTLTCVSNDVGGSLAGNARWQGTRLDALLARARPQPGADMVLSTSEDGWTAGTPLEVMTDPGRDCLLAIGMNGEPLPVEHGFPARLVVPGLYGYVSATKWVRRLTVTTFAADQGYWTPRGWSARGPIKLASRIDTPHNSVTPGRVAVAGVAWQQHVGVEAVQVRVDGGPWQDAELADTVGPDTWRQWVWQWDATAGSHELTVRARSADGRWQTEQRSSSAPDGATGWHSRTVQVG